MRADLSPAEVLAQSFVSDGAAAGAYPAGLQECVADMLQEVQRETAQYDDSLVICALVAVAVGMANAGNDNFRVALLLRNCARILEIEGRNK